MPEPSIVEIKAEFKDTVLAPDALAECQSICRTFDLHAKELFIRWQTYVINKHGGNSTINPTRERLLEVRKAIQQDYEKHRSQRRNGSAGQTMKPLRHRERTHYDKDTVEGLLHGIMSNSQRNLPRTPQSTKRVGILRTGDSTIRKGALLPMSPSVFSEPSPSAIRFSKRENRGRIEEVVHPELPLLKLSESRKPLYVRYIADILAIHKSTFSDFDGECNQLYGEEDGNDNDAFDEDTTTSNLQQNNKTSKAHQTRYMFEKMSVRTKTINKRIEKLAVDVKAEYNIEALANPTYPHQDLVTAVGRVLNFNIDDGPSNVQMNSDTLVLETSRRLGNGRRIPLEILSTPSFSLFPGQVVAVEGKNLKGNIFSVSEFKPLPVLPRLSTESYDISNPDPFTAIVASGPYTLSENFEYEPLSDLVDHIISESPSVVILLGPYVSENHPIIQSGFNDILPEDIFRSKIAPHLQRLKEALVPNSKVYLVPSPDELCSQHVSFPQPAFNNELLQNLGVPPGIQSLENPAQISINGVTMAISNIDILFHLVKEEISRLPSFSDRLPRLAWHLLEQRHFYPLSPTPLYAAGILASHDSKLGIIATPDILITPSQLRHFSRIHENVIMINPGYSSKGLAGGTFAKLHVHADGESPDTSMMLGGDRNTHTSERIRAEIVRI